MWSIERYAAKMRASNYERRYEMFDLLCPNCGARRQSPRRAAVCLECGNVAKVPPLTDGAFEKVGEDCEPVKSAKKKREPGKNRSPEDGGRVF